MDDRMIREAVKDIEPWMIDARRTLHQIPEPGFQEHKTQAFLIEQLQAIGIPFTTERTWIVGLIEGGSPGKVVGLRADMDALPLEENLPIAFSSCHPGYMHACGHDAHMAILLGAARVLFEHRDQLQGGVKLFFQPAEETVGGALPMVEAGCMEAPHVNWVFGLHIQPSYPVGIVETRAGAMNAATDALHFHVRGKSGHGAHPESGADAIVCAASIITALQTILSRNISPNGQAVIHIGKIEGGAAPNVVCDSVTMTGTMRTADPSLRALLKKRIREVAGGVSQAMGCGCEVDIVPDYAALVNHKVEAKLVLSVAERLFGAHSVVEADYPSMGGEDFAYFIDQTPGAFFHIGCADPTRMPAAPLHSRAFMLDERCLAVGAAMEVALVMELIGKKPT